MGERLPGSTVTVSPATPARSDPDSLLDQPQILRSTAFADQLGAVCVSRC
jgi:hypothetical protein